MILYSTACCVWRCASPHLERRGQRQGHVVDFPRVHQQRAAAERLRRANKLGHDEHARVVGVLARHDLLQAVVVVAPALAEALQVVDDVEVQPVLAAQEDYLAVVHHTRPRRFKLRALLVALRGNRFGDVERDPASDPGYA